MKTIRLILLLLAFSAVTFYACSDSDAVTQTPQTDGSIALRTALNQMKLSGLTGRSADDSAICFGFVYPVYLSYNNGTTVTITSAAGLQAILAQESADFYLEGISFPFQIQQEGAVQTIENETQFTNLLVGCGVATWNDELNTSSCFDLVFPIQVAAATASGTETIQTQQQFEAYLANAANGNEAHIIFPVTVLHNGQSQVISNVYDFYELINDCNSCNCNGPGTPVCVQTTVGTVTYASMCYAECAGYTQNDLVSCDPANDCAVQNLTVMPGDCNADGTYSLTIDFDLVNSTANEFRVYNGNNVQVGAFAVAALPVTIPNYASNSAIPSVLTIVPVGSTNCSASQQWAAPDCTPSCESQCPDTVNPVCVQTANGLQQFNNACLAECAGFSGSDFVSCTAAEANFGSALGSCFNIVYPVQVEHQGTLVTIGTDGECLQYWFPNLAPVPAFVYPVVVTQMAPTGPVTIEIHNQAEFISLINSCN